MKKTLQWSYRGTLLGLNWRVFVWLWRIIERESGQRGLVVLEKRWVGWTGHGPERTFGWLKGYRRLSKDHERLCVTSEAMIQLAMTRLMLNRTR